MTDPASSWPTLSILTLQLLDHWGNRTTPRAAPRADVLTAALALGELAGSGGPPPASPAVAWAERRSRYAALILADHLGLMATSAQLKSALTAEPTLRQVVTGAQHLTNLAVLGTVVKLAVVLMGDAPAGGQAQVEGFELRWVEPGLIRLHPWPFLGARLTVRADLSGSRGTWQLVAQGAQRP